MKDKFTVEITEESGEITMVISDHLTLTKVELTAKDLNDGDNGFNVAWMAKKIIELTKPGFREIQKDGKDIIA